MKFFSLSQLNFFALKLFSYTAKNFPVFSSHRKDFTTSEQVWAQLFRI